MQEDTNIGFFSLRPRSSGFMTFFSPNLFLYFFSGGSSIVLFHLFFLKFKPFLGIF